jgi:hypothetical protein
MDFSYFRSGARLARKQIVHLPNLPAYPPNFVRIGFGPAHSYSGHAPSRLLRHGRPCDTAPGIHSSADRREWKAPSDRTSESAHLARAGQWEHGSSTRSASGNALSNSLAVVAIRYLSSPSSFETAIHPALQPSTPMCRLFSNAQHARHRPLPASGIRDSASGKDCLLPALCIGHYKSLQADSPVGNSNGRLSLNAADARHHRGRETCP